MSLTKVTYSMIDGGSVNITDFGAVATPGTDNYAALARAITAATAKGLQVFVPAGEFEFGTTLVLNDYTQIVGETANTSILYYTGSENAIKCGSVNVIKDIYVKGNANANNGIVLGNDNGAATICSGTTIDSIRVGQFKRQGQVSAVTGYYSSGGSGYNGTTTITFSAPPSGTRATGTPVLDGDHLVGVTITNRGSGYTSPPTITTGGAGSGAVLRVYINSSGIVFRAAVNGHMSNSNITRNWRGMLFMFGGLNTTWQFDTNNIGYTEGTQAYWNGGPATQIEGLQASIWNNNILQTCGEEAVLCYSKYVEDVVFNVNYYEQPNIAKRGSCVLLTGDANVLRPIHVTFNNDLIGVQPTYPLPTTNGYATQTVLPMTEFVYSFEYAYTSIINQPKFVSENYYYTIYSGANALNCVFYAAGSGGGGQFLTNQDTNQQLQGIKLIGNAVGATTPLTLYGYDYSPTTGPVQSVNAVTPSVSGNNKFYQTANTSATAISTFFDAVQGQEIQVFISENYTSFDVASPLLFLKERNTNLLGATLTLIYENGAWTEQYRNYVENKIVTVDGGGNGFFSSFNTGLVQVINVTMSGAFNAVGQISLNGSANTVTIISDPSSKLANSLTAGKVCFYFDSGGYRGINNTGSTLTIQTKLV